MDAAKFLKELNRMCNIQGVCERCRMNKEDSLVCEENIKNIAEFHEIEKVIEIVEEWSKENPAKTNLDVFRETFPDWGTQTHLCCEECDVGYQNVPCSDCKWWSEKYKEEK
jgi:hypothetical protein